MSAVVKAQSGTLALSDNEMILGYTEAIMMIKKGELKGVDDIVKDEGGLTDVEVVGILAQSGILLDDYHIFNKNTFAKTEDASSVKYVAEKEILKAFYFVTGDNVPEKLKDSITSFNPIQLGGNTYLPIYIGFAEVKMMIQKKLISKAGDTIDNLFGNKVMVAGILPETKTILDSFHFAGSQFALSE
jgi:hypothetical protein